ncbi:MAG: hypothetical protein KDJ65_32590 [Anaerolineae bacterium]|nr:hypothetical protein [Anaerolineae bacterium]
MFKRFWSNPRQEKWESVVKQEMTHCANMLQNRLSWVNWYNAKLLNQVSSGFIPKANQRVYQLWDNFYSSNQKEMDYLNYLGDLLSTHKHLPDELIEAPIDQETFPPHRLDLKTAIYGLEHDLQACRLVLDDQMTEALYNENKTLHVNWFAFESVCSFDTVEIRRATDQAVEKFCLLLGNDTDPDRIDDYKQAKCTITCDLSKNSIRVLQNFLGEVSL